jgi:very-short-patch-repair endonuclease
MNTPKQPFHTPPALWENLKPLVRQMRHDPTPAEDAVWQRVRNRQIAGAKFRRQYTIERFVVDFVCLERRLIIEVDGEIHQYQQGEDEIRQAFLESQGFRVVRFRNEDVMGQIEDVVGQIESELRARK